MRNGGFSRARCGKIFKITMQIGGKVRGRRTKQWREETISSLDCNIGDRCAMSITTREKEDRGQNEGKTMQPEFFIIKFY